MNYTLEYFQDRVLAEIESWPDGILADYARTVHAFIKKSQSTPEQELKIARKRLKEVQNG